MVITLPQLQVIGTGCPLWSAISARNVKGSGLGTFTVLGKHLLPSVAAYFADHLRSEVPTCSDSRGFADTVVDFLKVCLRSVFNLTRSFRVQRGFHVRLPLSTNR
jgi:hypothetical protein